jgi:hypothetical protein
MSYASGKRGPANHDRRVGDVQGPRGCKLADHPRRCQVTIPRWRANNKLVRKHYLVSDDGRMCAGLYIWPTRAEAEAEQAHDAQWRAGVQQRTAAAPKISYFDLMMLLDNEAGTVTEWSQNGEGGICCPP